MCICTIEIKYYNKIEYTYVTALKGLRTPQSISAGLCQHCKAWWSLLSGTPIFVSWAHYLDGHPSKEIDESQSLIAKMHMTVMKH